MDSRNGRLSVFFEPKCSLFRDYSDDRIIIYALFHCNCYYFQRTVTSEMYSTIKDDNNISSINLNDHINCLCAPNRTQGPKHKSHVSDNLLKCSFFISLATLCRYEAWPIPVVLTLFIILRYLEINALDKGLEIRLSNRKRLMCGLICIALSFSGIILWISYNTIYFNSPFEFFFSPYYSVDRTGIRWTKPKLLVFATLECCFYIRCKCSCFLWAYYHSRSNIWLYCPQNVRSTKNPP